MKNQSDGDSNSDKRTAAATNLDDIVVFSQTPEGRAQTIAHIKRHGGPLYEADSKYPDLIVEVSPDGTKRLGRLVYRKFVGWRPHRPSGHEPRRPSRLA